MMENDNGITNIIICCSIFSMSLVVYVVTTVYYLIKEKQRIKRMEMNLEQSVGYLVKSFDELSADVKTIKRGLYGDPENKVIGLIARQENDEKRLDAIEEADRNLNLKKKWIAAALLGAAGVLDWVLHYWKEIFGR